MKYCGSRFRVLASAVTIAAGLGLTSAQAQVYVLESTADTVKPGTALKAADRITIPAGGSIRAVMPSGKTQTIQGPFSGPASQLAQGHNPNAGVMAWLQNLLRTGGSREQTAGATRNFRPAGAPQTFSWTAIPATTDSTFCASRNAKLQLRRAPSKNAERLIVVNPATAERGEVDFAAGSDVAPWPASVALQANATYSVVGGESGQRRQITLRVLDRLPGEEDLVAELATRDCTYQLDAWTREKVAAAKKGS
jgi:hypothetical protein